MTPEEYRGLMARGMTEKQLLAAVRALAEGLSWRTYHTHRSQHSPAGFPDLCLVRRGRLVFAELKTELGKTSPDQDVWLASLAAVAAETWDTDPLEAVVRVYVWRPADLLDGAIERILT